MRLSARDELTLFVNHLKSEFVGGRQLSPEALRRAQLETRRKRLAQASYVAELVAALPQELLDLTWSCRRPIDGFRPCGACKACRAREMANLQGLRAPAAPAENRA